MRINVGCGQTPTKGWRNFDNSLSLRLAKIPFLPYLFFKAKLINKFQYQFIQFARSHQIEYGDAIKGLPLLKGTVAVFYSSHMIEHLDQTEAILFLKEAQRILCSGGIIRLAVPDLYKQVQQYIRVGDADTFISGTYLCQKCPKTLGRRLYALLVGNRDHRWMYDANSLRSLLLRNGFTNVTIMPPGESKIQDPEPLDLKEKFLESVYVEAENP